MPALLLTSTQNAVLHYCIFNYGGSYKFSGTRICIFNGPDEFRIDLRDLNRFGKYIIYHRNTQRSLDGKYHFHRQGYSDYLPHAFFLCFTHHFYKTHNIPIEKGDFSRFKNDALKYKDLF